MEIKIEEIGTALEEAIKKKPEIIMTTLRQHPEFLEKVISSAIPWQNIATKDDIKLMVELINKRFEELLHYMDKRFELQWTSVLKS
jgi:hypothetical protein